MCFTDGKFLIFALSSPRKSFGAKHYVCPYKLTLRELAKYGHRLKAADLQPGACPLVSIVGVPGSGKTTFLEGLFELSTAADIGLAEPRPATCARRGWHVLRLTHTP